MWVISQNSDIVMDFTAAEITDIIEENPQTGERVRRGWRIIAHSFGTAFILAQYGNEELARKIFIDMAAHLKKGEEFYDIKDREKTFLQR